MAMCWGVVMAWTNAQRRTQQWHSQDRERSLFGEASLEEIQMEKQEEGLKCQAGRLNLSTIWSHRCPSLGEDMARISISGRPAWWCKWNRFQAKKKLRNIQIKRGLVSGLWLGLWGWKRRGGFEKLGQGRTAGSRWLIWTGREQAGRGEGVGRLEDPAPCSPTADGSLSPPVPESVTVFFSTPL